MACEPNDKTIADVKLTINGSEVELNTFVSNFITYTIMGMVKSLRGVTDTQNISLEISKLSE